MTRDELAKHGLRVKDLDYDDPGMIAKFIVHICDAVEPIAPPDVAQAARVADRIQGNAGELADEYGPIDEICASGCDVHLERLQSGNT